MGESNVCFKKLIVFYWEDLLLIGYGLLALSSSTLEVVISFQQQHFLILKSKQGFKLMGFVQIQLTEDKTVKLNYHEYLSKRSFINHPPFLIFILLTYVEIQHNVFCPQLKKKNAFPNISKFKSFRFYFSLNPDLLASITTISYNG